MVQDIINTTAAPGFMDVYANRINVTGRLLHISKLDKNEKYQQNIIITQQLSSPVNMPEE